MTSEDRNWLNQAKTFLCRGATVLRAARKLDEANRHLAGLQWSCPAEVNVTSGVGLAMQGLLEQAQQDVDDAWNLIDLVDSGDMTVRVMASPEPEPEPEVKVEPSGVDSRYDYDWPEDTTRLTVEGFNSVVDRHIAHAIEKHSLFAHELCDRQDSYAQSAEVTQTAVKAQLAAGCVYADTLLFEEVYEFLAEVQKGDITRAKEEAGDVTAVLYRMIKKMEEQA